MKKHHLTLTDNDRGDLETLLSKGNLKALTFKRATALLLLDRGKTLVAVASTLGVTTKAVANWCTRYSRSGLTCLYDAPRSGRPTVFDGVQRAKITALATSDAPEGYARWSLRLLADKAIESGICENVSYTFVREVLKKTSSSHI
jgi:transposase